MSSDLVQAGSAEIASFIISAIRRQVAEPGTTTQYREPLVGFVNAGDPRFLELRRVAEPTHLTPQELLPGARSVVSFFLPFASGVVEANAHHKTQVAREWALAYVETNALIGHITDSLIESLAGWGINAAAEPATHVWSHETFTSRWSHKSVGVIAGLGSFGLHQMVITDAGCAGRFGSLVLDAELPATPAPARERCLYFHDGSCLECVQRCPAAALDKSKPLDKARCHDYLHGTAQTYATMGLADACGKCAIGPCSFEAAVRT